MTRDDLRKKLETVAKAARIVFATPEGETVLADLEAAFVYGDLLGDTPEKTAFNLGAREVVLYLRALNERGQTK